MIELLPYTPEPQDYAQDFDYGVSNIDMSKKDLDVWAAHYPLLKHFVKHYFNTYAANVRPELPPERVHQVAERCLEELLKIVQRVAVEDKRDVLFINSY